MTVISDTGTAVASPPTARILVVDDERSMREMLQITTRRRTCGTAPS